MGVGIMLGEVGGLDAVVKHVRLAAQAGLTSVWFPQLFSVDALIAIAVAGREVPGIELGTAVVATYPRHPVLLAQQALTAQVASGGRLTLGIGVSHAFVIEGMLGLSFEKPARHMHEYLCVLQPLLREGAVDYTGMTLRTKARVRVPGAEPCPVLLAAMAPLMLQLAGSAADGTITWMTGPHTIATHIAPLLNRAADEAGRPAPRLVAGLPVCVTDHIGAARERAVAKLDHYGQVPSYRSMLDRESAARPADVALIGNEQSVTNQVERLTAAGMTDLLALEFGTPDERERTRALLGSLAEASGSVG